VEKIYILPTSIIIFLKIIFCDFEKKIVFLLFLLSKGE